MWIYHVFDVRLHFESYDLYTHMVGGGCGGGGGGKGGGFNVFSSAFMS